jgi:hypothetical protein
VCRVILLRMSTSDPSAAAANALRAEVAQLPPGGEPHWHIVLTIPDPDNAEPLVDHRVSTPYGAEEVAQGDARKFRELMLGTQRHYRMAVLLCERRCPRSGIGDFGWPI